HNQFAEVLVLQKLGEQAHENHGGRDFAPIGTLVELGEKVIGHSPKRLRSHAAPWNGATERPAALLKVRDLGTVVLRLIEWGLGNVFIGNGDSEAAAKFAEFVFVELLLLVRDVLPFAGLAEPVAFDGPRQDNSGRSSVLDRGFIGGVNLLGVVPAQSHLA